MIFLIEHEKGVEHRFRILINYDEIDPNDFEPIKSIFFCETLDEAIEVMEGLREMDE
jgi:hypothetical protein